MIEIYKTVILSLVLFGCEPWSLKLKEEYRLWLFRIRVLRGLRGQGDRRIENTT
jgi:hypothetical protein